MNQGVRPNKLWHWVAIAALTATFLAEPRAFLAMSWELFRGMGAVGGELLTRDPEPDILNLNPQPDGERLDSQDNGEGDGLGDSGDSGDSFSTAPDPGDPGTYRVDGDGIRSVLDTGRDLVVGLHREVEQVQDNGGVTVELGNGGRS